MEILELRLHVFLFAPEPLEVVLRRVELSLQLDRRRVIRRFPEPRLQIGQCALLCDAKRARGTSLRVVSRRSTSAEQTQHLLSRFFWLIRESASSKNLIFCCSRCSRCCRSRTISSAFRTAAARSAFALLTACCARSCSASRNRSISAAAAAAMSLA